MRNTNPDDRVLAHSHSRNTGPAKTPAKVARVERVVPLRHAFARG
jgi:hypothetical protein